MKCSRCSRELSEAQSYVHQGKVFCEDCLMDIGLSSKECDPWATYVDSRERGLKDEKRLTDAEWEIFAFIVDRRKATREEVMQKFKLSETELKVQLTPLMHAELIKERSEKGIRYMIPIPVSE